MTIRAEERKKLTPTTYYRGDAYTRGYWWTSLYVRYQIRARRVWFCCPKCSNTMSLGDYRIDSKGRAAPTVTCPRSHCDFAEDITLFAWDPEVREYHV